MRRLIQISLFLFVTQQAFAFSKYGRTCKDIGCLSSEICVMAEDPCSYYNREQCGSYPTCKKVSDAAPSCERFTCPPTQMCQNDHGTPKCVPMKSTATVVHHSENTNSGSSNTNAQNPAYPSYPSQNPSAPNNPSYPSYPSQNPSAPSNPSYPSYPQQPSAPSYPPQNPSQPNAPSYPSGGLYPSLTTSRPSQGASYTNQGGYSGGAPGSGYPGYPGYPQQPYNNRGGYPNQGYPSNQGNYPGYPGYPNSNYPNSGYPQSGYPYGSSNNRGGYGYGNSGSNPIVDKITDQLKVIGAGILKNALGLNKQSK